MTDPSYARFIMTTARDLGIKLPKAITTAQDSIDAVRRAHDSIPRPAIADAFTAAVLKNRDPLSDPEVVRAIVSERLVADGMGRAAADACERRLCTTIGSHQQQLVDLMRVPFDTAVAHLTEAHDLFGDLNLDDTTNALRAGGSAANVWGSAVAAIKTVKQIEKMWHATHALNQQTMLTTTSKRSSLCWLDPGKGMDEWIPLPPNPIDAWQATRLGFTLALADPDEYARRLKTVTEEPERRAALRFDAEQQAVRTRFGTGVA